MRDPSGCVEATQEAFVPAEETDGTPVPFTVNNVNVTVVELNNLTVVRPKRMIKISPTFPSTGDITININMYTGLVVGAGKVLQMLLRWSRITSSGHSSYETTSSSFIEPPTSTNTPFTVSWTESISTLGWEPGDILQLEVYRDVAHVDKIGLVSFGSLEINI